MSRAFIRETDGSGQAEPLPARQVSNHRNFVTRRGLDLIEAEIAAARETLDLGRERDDKTMIARAARDLTYWSSRHDSAELVPLPSDTEEVRFGLSVTLKDSRGDVKTYTIVGQDEADPALGLISYVSPLAQALLGLEEGETVETGPNEFEIVSIGTQPPRLH